MKLNLVSPRTGVTWAKSGIRVFMRQPLAMVGLFFMFMALLSVATLIPLIGGVLALAVLPAATLGLMAATKEAEGGKFPMPAILISAFRAGRDQARAMMVLGAIYAVGFLLLLGVSALFDGGQFAKLYLMGGQVNEELVTQPGFQSALWVALALYLPLSLMFWHAPALVHWHGVSPVKSLFFSFMACYKNFGAFVIYGLVWMGLFVAMGLLVTLVATFFSNPALAGVAMFPAAMLMVAMFFSSIYFSFKDCFSADDDSSDQPRPESIDVQA